MPAGKRNRRRDLPIAFFFMATVLVAALLIVDDVILYLFLESFFEVRPALMLRLTIAVIFLLLNLVLIWLVFKSRQQKAQTGMEAMIGKSGVVARVNETGMWVQIHGELWRARCRQSVQAGEAVVVLSLNGLVLQVEPITPGENT